MELPGYLLRPSHSAHHRTDPRVVWRFRFDLRRRHHALDAHHDAGSFECGRPVFVQGREANVSICVNMLVDGRLAHELYLRRGKGVRVIKPELQRKPLALVNASTLELNVPCVSLVIDN